MDRSPRGPDGEPTGFDLALAGADPSDATTQGRDPWTMTGSDGTDRLVAALSPDEASRLAARVVSGWTSTSGSTKTPALHDQDGWIDFGAAGGSYYYSRTAMDAIRGR